MPNNKLWSNVVFVLSLSAYIPVLIGGWKHPVDSNVACFSLWIILSLVLCYSAKVQGFAGWKLQFAFFFGNIVVVLLALIRGGYTFNLGISEMIVLYGMILVISIWVLVGYWTKKWNPRILYLGTILVDITSFYPVLKQYLQPHDRPTTWMIVGWSMYALAALINVIFAERFIHKLRMDYLTYGINYDKRKGCLQILEESAFSIENFFLILITIVLMCR